MSLVTKPAWATLKQEVDTVVKNPYFKFPANLITLSILNEFSLEKIESNIKADALFLHPLIKIASSIKKVNAANNDKNMSTTTLLVTKSREDCQFWYNERESKGGKNNTVNKFNSDKDSNKNGDNSDSDSELDIIEKSYRNCYQNKTVIANVSFCMMVYIRNKYTNLL